MTKKSITEIIREQHAIQKERGGRWDEKGWAERVIEGSIRWEDPEYHANQVAAIREKRYLGPVVGINHDIKRIVVLRSIKDYKLKGVSKALMPRLMEDDKEEYDDLIWKRTTDEHIAILLNDGYIEVESKFLCQTQYLIVGTNVHTGARVVFNTMKEAKDHGYNAPHITACIAGREVHYKQMHWTKEQVDHETYTRLVNQPKKKPTFKRNELGYVGTHIDTDDTVRFKTAAELTEAGFSLYHVLGVVRGDRKHHRNYVWTREQI
jgi:hypothetical protein